MLRMLLYYQGGDHVLQEKFGEFLIEQRKKRNLTQKEIAKKIGVSTAAVSKWERGLCLPEISKFEDIAKVFDMTLAEVMQCKEGDNSAESFSEVLRETINTSEEQHKHKARKIGVIMLAAFVICAGIYFFPIYHVFQVWSLDYFSTGEVSKLIYIGGHDDRNLARLFMAQADEAFSDLSTPENQMDEKYGLLSQYATGVETGGVSETHSLKLWSAHFGDNVTDGYGYVWVYYSNEVKDAKGNVVQASSRIPALWIFEKPNDGNWKLIQIKEHP